jgi:ADP-ribosyl-[dinitrogen reductase] hydrolase
MGKAMKDRAAGVLLGQACGDALGVPYEHGTPPTGEAEMLGGGLGPYGPAEWSDDTQMAVCIARVSATGADLRSAAALDKIASAFEAWLRMGSRDVGVQTRQVLGAAARLGGRPAERLTKASRAHYEQTNHSAGNGALMRTAIVGLTSIADRVATAEAARAIAELTHADPLAWESCVLWSETIRVAANEHQLDLRSGLDLLPAESRDRWAGWITEAEAPETAPSLRKNGFMVTALQAAWHAIVTTPVPEDDPNAGTFACQHLQHALHAAVRIGYDTDTVAAIAGGLLGAYWGASAVPASWQRIVHGWPDMRARDLVSLGVLTVRGGHPDSAGWPTAERMEYATNPDLPVPVRHPYDPQVWLGGVDALDHLPDGVDTVVSLCRLGATQVPARGVAATDHVEVWLIDSSDTNKNPNLDFVLADAAGAVSELVAEGRTVLLHCVHAQSRTPVVAALYGARLKGRKPTEALIDIVKVLPEADHNRRLWQALDRLG